MPYIYTIYHICGILCICGSMPWTSTPPLHTYILWLLYLFPIPCSAASRQRGAPACADQLAKHFPTSDVARRALQEARRTARRALDLTRPTSSKPAAPRKRKRWSSACVLEPTPPPPSAPRAVAKMRLGNSDVGGGCLDAPQRGGAGGARPTRTSAYGASVFPLAQVELPHE
jgi:hypothetical protein